MPPPLAEIPALAPQSSPAETHQAADATVREAESLDNEAQSLWGTSTDAPELVGRAGWLIRHAEALVKAPRCEGRDRQLAWEELKKAAAAYQALRDAISRGETPDLETGLRRIAERVSLAPAKAAKSCAGQATGSDAAHRGGARGAGEAERTCRTKAEALSAPTASTEVDLEKDRALMDAFAEASQAAAKNMRAA